MNAARYFSPVWKHFTPDKTDKKFAICNHCKASISRGSDIPRKQTTKSLELHLKKQHPNEFKPSKNEAESSNLKRPANEESDCVRLFNLRSKKDRKTMLCHTIPGWVASTNKYDFHSEKAQSLHKSAFEMIVLDGQPFTFVNDPGFIRLCYQMDPRFELASDKYYRDKLEPVFQNVKSKLKALLEHQNPSTIAISLDGWSQFHHGYMGIICHYIYDWKRYEFTLACRPLDISHTAQNIHDCLKNVLEDWKILDRTKVALRDNAANMVRVPNLRIYTMI